MFFCVQETDTIKKIYPLRIERLLSSSLVLACNEVRAELANATFCQTEACPSDLKQRRKMDKFGRGDAAVRTYSNNINTASRIPGTVCGRGTGFCYTAFDRRVNTLFAAALGELTQQN